MSRTPSFLSSKKLEKWWCLGLRPWVACMATKQEDLCVEVQNLLQQTQSRFQTMSESIISKIDEMGNRIDELGQSIYDLRSEMGIDRSRLHHSLPNQTMNPKAANDSA